LVVSALLAQNGIHRIEHVCPYHADFVNDQKIKAPDDLPLFPAEAEHSLFVLLHVLRPGNVRAKGKLEKGVQGDPAGVDGRNTRRSRYDHSFCRITFEAMEKGGLARAGLARQKNIFSRVFDKIPGKGKLIVLYRF
jgi:hypothetical protein